MDRYPELIWPKLMWFLNKKTQHNSPFLLVNRGYLLFIHKQSLSA